MSRDYCDYLIDLLRSWAPVVARPMFSGFGLYRDGQIFALVVRDTLYFKAYAASAEAYKAHGAEPFAYTARGDKRVLMSYWQVPGEILEDGDALTAWAERAYGVALAGQAGKKRREPARGARRVRQR